MNKNIFLVFLLFSSTISLLSQTGKLEGKIIDGEFSDPLANANIIVKENKKGTVSDFDGLFSIRLAPGIYTLEISFVGYQSKILNNIEIKEDDVTYIEETLVSGNIIGEIIIKTSKKRNTESAILSVQKKSTNVMDGLSSQSFKKIGVSNVASAIKSVPGVSVQGGKYVYVRGLGDRYTKTMLNGVDIPGLDPDKNTIQMDIFPTNILDNITVVKSATADLPADFTGGVVNIVTKDFPTKLQRTFSISGNVNPSMHFNDKFLQYKGSSTDFLGFDNGQRDVPISRNTVIPQAFENNSDLTGITNKFNTTLRGTEKSNANDFGLGFTYGNQFEVGSKGKKLGVFASVSYKNATKFYENFERGLYKKDRISNENKLVLDKRQVGNIGSNNILLSGLAGITLKKEYSKFKLNIMHLQNGESKAGNFDQVIEISDAAQLIKSNLEYTQRSITNILLQGRHSNKEANWKADWSISPSISRVYDKDVRNTAFEYDEDTGLYIINPGTSGYPQRIWRNLEEINLVFKADVTRKHKLFEKDAKLKFGAGYVFKNRDFSIDNYQLEFTGSTSHFNGDANTILTDTNIWTPINNGAYVTNIFDITSVFESYTANSSAYVSEEFKLSAKFKTILGVRFEKFDLFYTGQNQAGESFSLRKIIDKADFFPSANLIYSLNDDTNLRFSYSKTTARPSFKEASNAQIADPLTGTTFIGNIDIKPTYIDNLDVRYEFYGNRNELIALSTFYKSFKDPIELSFFASTTDQFEPRNIGKAKVYGAEVELRKNLNFITESLDKFSIKGNFSYIKSEQKYGEDEKILRESNLRDGESLDSYRELQGQSPYLINAGINYDHKDKGFQAGLFYNAQGKTLRVVGTGVVPEVYSFPFHNLNFNLNKSFGTAKKQNISFKVTNILDQDFKSVFQSYKAEDQIFELKKPGQNISLSYSIKF